MKNDNEKLEAAVTLAWDAAAWVLLYRPNMPIRDIRGALLHLLGDKVFADVEARFREKLPYDDEEVEEQIFRNEWAYGPTGLAAHDRKPADAVGKDWVS